MIFWRYSIFSNILLTSAQQCVLWARTVIYLNDEIGAALHFRFSWRLKWQRNGPLMNGHDESRARTFRFGRSDRKHHSNIILLHYFTANFVMIKITFDRSITTGSTAHIPKKSRGLFRREKKRIHHSLVVFDILWLAYITHIIKRRLSNLSKMILKCFVIRSRSHNFNSKQR